MHAGEPHRKLGVELLCICNSMCANVGQPLVLAASWDHPLLAGVTPRARILLNVCISLSASDSISTCDHSTCCCSCIPLCTTVDCIPEVTDKTQIKPHCTITCLTSWQTIISRYCSSGIWYRLVTFKHSNINCFVSHQRIVIVLSLNLECFLRWSDPIVDIVLILSYINNDEG